MVGAEIAKTPLFAQVSDEAIAMVASGVVTDVTAGQILAQAGDPGAGMCVVLSGSVTVQRGDLQIEIESGGFFGELALLVPDSPRIARVRASSDSRILAISRPTFQFLLDTEPAFTRALLHEVASRLVQARTGG
jgi:CRP-like cAMP-binding protein